MTISEFSIRRPVFTVMITLVIVVVASSPSTGCPST